MDIFEEIKSRVSMKEVLEHYGVYPVRGKNIYKCIEHAPDKNPSANIVKGKELFHCFACNKTWDIFDVVKYFEKCDNKQAVKVIDSKFGLGLLRPLSRQEKIEMDIRQKQREKQKQEKLEWEEYRHKLLCEIIRDEFKIWSEIQRLTSPTCKNDYDKGWEFEDLYFYSLKRERWLDWLFFAVLGWGLEIGDSQFDYIYPVSLEPCRFAIDNKEILTMIKSGKIKI